MNSFIELKPMLILFNLQENRKLCVKLFVRVEIYVQQECTQTHKNSVFISLQISIFKIWTIYSSTFMWFKYSKFAWNKISHFFIIFYFFILGEYQLIWKTLDHLITMFSPCWKKIILYINMYKIWFPIRFWYIYRVERLQYTV